MTPVIRHLRNSFPTLPLPVNGQTLNWSFATAVKELDVNFYSKVMPLHPILNMEYSILCNQIRHHFSFPQNVRREQLIEELTAALMLAELLEHLHRHYLDVPREVVRLREQQKIYRQLLLEMTNYSFVQNSPDTVDVGYSLSQRVRDNTAFANWFRLLMTRSKRVLNFLDLVGTGSDYYRNFVASMDQYTNPIFATVAWCFFLPRLITNLSLMVKHTFPWSTMSEEERGLGWSVRFLAHLQRRWFELVNDIIWVTVGLINGFVMVGALAPLSVYVSVCAFALDVAAAGLRAYMELKRLYELQAEYTQMFEDVSDAEEQRAIKDYQIYINHRIEFEQLRLGFSIAANAAVLIAMSFALPFIAVNPVIPFIGALLLIAIWIIAFTLTRVLEHYRPNDTVEVPSNLSQLSFFSPRRALADPSAVRPQPSPEFPRSSEISLA